MSDSFAVGPEFRSAITERDSREFGASSVTSSTVSNESDASNFNGHTIKETTDSHRDQLIQAYLGAKAKYDQALEKLNYTKGLNWLGKAFWNSMAKVGIGKWRSTNYCQQKLQKAFDSYDAAGTALTTHESFGRYRDREGFADHEALNNKVHYDISQKISIGANKFPIQGSYEAGAILRHEIDLYYNKQQEKITDPWYELKRDTKNGIWKIERDQNDKITSISYDDTISKEEDSSTSLDEVIAAIKEFAGPNENIQRAAACAVSPNEFAYITTLKAFHPQDPDNPIKNTQGPKSLRQLDTQGHNVIKTVQQQKENFKTVLTRNSCSELTIVAFQKTENDYLINCDKEGNALPQGAATQKFTYKEEDSFTRVIKQNSDGSASMQTTNLLLKHQFSDIQNTIYS